MLKKLGLTGYEDLPYFLEQKTKDVLFIIADWNAKVGSQEIPRVTGKLGLGVQNEAGQRPTEFYQENTLVIASTFSQQHKIQLYKWTSPDCHYQNLIIFTQPKIEKLCAVSKSKTWS